MQWLCPTKVSMKMFKVPDIFVITLLFLYSMPRSAGQVASVRCATAENLFLYYLTIDAVAVPLLSFTKVRDVKGSQIYLL